MSKIFSKLFVAKKTFFLRWTEANPGLTRKPRLEIREFEIVSPRSQYFDSATMGPLTTGNWPSTYKSHLAKAEVSMFK